ETPLLARRTFDFARHAQPLGGRFAIEGVTHVLTGRDLRSALGPGIPAGSALIYRNPDALPRVRLMGRPLYVTNDLHAIETLDELQQGFTQYLIVEDPDEPLANASDAFVPGSA